ncbi:MAG: ABC transporter permease [Alphaproteobacteria bacterium]|nr:ABC transporter permease [Alphaproteobacteria bacterium]
MTLTERTANIAVWVIAAATGIFLLTPLVVAIVVSFGSSNLFTLPPPGWSMRWYQRLMNVRGLSSSLIVSAQIAAVATLVSMLIGGMAATALARGRFPGRDAIATFVVSPLMMPGLVVGVAMLQFLRELGLRDAYTSLLIAHIVITMPYVMRTVMASLSLFDFSLIDAARTLGCSYPRALRKVMVPVLAPAFLTSGLFAFLASLDNYPISIFFTDPRTKTLPIQMLQFLEEQPDPSIAAISSLLIGLVLLLLLLCERMVGLRKIAEM